MNQVIAKLYGTLLKLLHIFVLVFIIGITFFAYDIFDTHFLGDYVWVYALISLVIYIVVIGFVTVVVAIHENLGEMKAAIVEQNRLLRDMNGEAHTAPSNNDSLVDTDANESRHR
ncbi:hypothetical protein [Thiomicrospira cyclica]|uniref:Uncharacterized protein n=1 Tax=Thiomicrospira cyclica (strain DSM 14477 / JCM 11371 / ALM1) TaxID=717773 RepID=F6DBC1_THICA|nr:hypothetical protein [Thiomicrospira cyclica]AEG31229.1 hypothetical protein Thicy_0456 [Thiomicrospira cyclica ALM1]